MKEGRGFCILTGLVVVTLAWIQPGQADEGSWSTNGPYGASIMAIALHPSDTLRIYIGTVSGGIFETTDGGEEWFRIEDDTLEHNLRRIRIHPLGPDTMYASTVRGIFKSTDAGQSWSRLPLAAPTSEYPTLEIHPDDPSMLFSGCLAGPRKSTDGGATWYDNRGNIPVFGNVEDIAIDPVNTNVVYSTGGRDHKSEDYGETWQDISPAPFGTTSPVCVTVDPVDTEIIYLGRSDYHSRIGTCLYRSTNGGGDWTDVTPAGLVGGRVNDVLVSPLDHNIVIIATLFDGVFRTSDGGQNWEAINEGLHVAETNGLVFDPRTGCIYLGVYLDGLFRSTNNGDSWEKISYYDVSGAYCTGIACNWRHPDTLYVATQGGLFISTDGAESWERINVVPPDCFFKCGHATVDPYDPSYVYAPFFDFNLSHPGGAFYRSSDGGATWELFTEGLPRGTFYFRVIVADYHDGGWRRLFLETSEGIYSSDDLGESWLPYEHGFLSRVITVSPIDPEIVFAGGLSSGVYKSTDGGTSWDELNAPRGIADEMACDPVDPDIVYMTMEREGFTDIIFKSTDGGQSWDNITNDLPRPEYPGIFIISGLAINPLNNSNVFVYSGWCGAYQSHNGGENWEDFYNESLRIGPIGYTLIDPVDTSRVFLAQYGQSVWEITRIPTGIDDGNDHISPSAFSAGSYPNPFNASAAIEYSLPERAFVTVDIYDLLGRRVERLAAADQRPGDYRVLWDAKDRASGLYYYKIDAGQHSRTGVMTLLK